MSEEKSPYCSLCEVLVDDDLDEYMVNGRCLQCDKAFQAGRSSLSRVSADNENLRIERDLMYDVVKAAHLFVGAMLGHIPKDEADKAYILMREGLKKLQQMALDGKLVKFEGLTAMLDDGPVFLPDGVMSDGGDGRKDT